MYIIKALKNQLFFAYISGYDKVIFRRRDYKTVRHRAAVITLEEANI